MHPQAHVSRLCMTFNQPHCVARVCGVDIHTLQSPKQQPQPQTLTQTNATNATNTTNTTNTNTNKHEQTRANTSKHEHTRTKQEPTRTKKNQQEPTNNDKDNDNTTTTTTTTTTSVSLRQVDLFCVSNCGATLAVGEGTSPSRRRQRRLRSWLRHERQTVAMELAAALHHSRDARSNVVHSALRGQKASSGTRPAPHEEVSEPQGGAVTDGYVAALAPWVARPALAAPTADGVDAAALSFLVTQSLAQQEKEKAEEKERAKVQKLKEEKEERRMQWINAKVRDDLPLIHEEHQAWRRWIGIAPASSSSSSALKRRKRKKSSHSSSRRARRRQRQWHTRHAGFPGDVPLRAVFPSSVGLPELPGTLAGVFEKDSGVLIVDSGSGISQTGFADISPRAVFLSVVAWPQMLCILAGMDQKEFLAFLNPCSDMCKACIVVLRLAVCFLWLSAGLRVGRYGPEEQICSLLVLLAMMLLALCSCSLSSGPRCSASWPV